MGWRRRAQEQRGEQPGVPMSGHSCSHAHTSCTAFPQFGSDQFHVHLPVTSLPPEERLGMYRSRHASSRPARHRRLYSHKFAHSLPGWASRGLRLLSHPAGTGMSLARRPRIACRRGYQRLAAPAPPVRLHHRLCHPHFVRLAVGNACVGISRRRLTMFLTGRIDPAAATPFVALARRRDGRVLLRGLRRAAFRSFRSVIALRHANSHFCGVQSPPATAPWVQRSATVSAHGSHVCSIRVTRAGRTP